MRFSRAGFPLLFLGILVILLFSCDFADRSSPTVALTSPADGSTVGGPSVAIEADASDNVEVAVVEFFLNGASIGSAHTAPFAIAWDSTSAADSLHELSAIATDASGNISAADVISITVNNEDPRPLWDGIHWDEFTWE